MNKLFYLLVSLSFIFNAYADRRGNGGDVVVCYEDETYTTKISTELLDYYEVRKRGGVIELGGVGNYLDRVNYALDRLSLRDRRIADEFRGIVANILSEISFISDQVLTDIPDSDEDFRGKACQVRQVAVYIPLALPGNKKYLIAQDHWDELSENDKAGLILHEMIYTHILKFGAKNSIDARAFNGLISGEKINQLSPAEFRSLKRRMHLYFFKLQPATNLKWIEGNSLHASWKIPKLGGMVEKQVLEVFTDNICDSYPLDSISLDPKVKDHKVKIEKFLKKLKNRSEASFHFQITNYDHVKLKAISVCSKATVEDSEAPESATLLLWEEGSVSNIVPVHARWSISSSEDIKAQRIKIYKHNTCFGPAIEEGELSQSADVYAFKGAVTNNNYSFTIDSIDGSSNVTTSSCSSSIFIDTIAPGGATGLSWNDISPTNSRFVTAIWVPALDDDLVSQEFQLYSDGACSIRSKEVRELNSFENQITVDLSGGKAFYYNITSIDTAGNKTESICSPAMIVDIEAPLAPVVTGWAQGVGRVNVTILTSQWTLGGSDDVASHRVEYFTDGGCSISAGAPVIKKAIDTTDDFAGVDGQTYYYRVAAIDDAGNESSSSCSKYGIIIDTSVPVSPTLLSWVETSPFSGTTATAAWVQSASSDIKNQTVILFSDGSCSVAETGLDLSSTSSQISINGLVNGNIYTYMVVLWDSAGNQSTSPCSEPIYIDTVAPVGSSKLLWAEGRISNSLSANANWSSSSSGDELSEIIRIYEDDAACSGTPFVTKSLAPGVEAFEFTLGSSGYRYSYNIESIDGAGNSTVSACSAQVLLDTNLQTNLSVSVDSYSNISRQNMAAYNLRGKCSHNKEVIRVDIGGIVQTSICTNSVWSSTFDVSGLADGVISIYVDHYDRLGNTAVQATALVTKDTTPPLVVIRSSPDIVLVNVETYTFSGTCSEDTQVVSVDVGGLADTSVCTSGTWSATLDVTSLADGTVTITADHLDAVGNSAVQSTVDVVKDILVPTVAITNSPDITLANVTSYVVSGTCSEDTQIVSVDVGGVTDSSVCTSGAWSSTLDVSSLADGVISIYVDHYDRLGNSAIQSVASITKDTSNYSEEASILTRSSFAAMNIGGATRSTIVVFEDNTHITLNGIELPESPLSQGETLEVETKQFDVVNANKSIYVAGNRNIGAGGASQNGNIVWALKSFADKSFSFYAVRYNPQAISLFAMEDSIINISSGSHNFKTVKLARGRGINIKLNFLGSYQIKSSGKILAYHFSKGDNLVADPKPLLPSSGELIGFPSNSMRLTPFLSSTKYSFIHSNSKTGSGYFLNSSEGRIISPEGDIASSYNSESLLINTKKLISGSSIADSDGHCSAPFLPTNLMRKRFAVNVSSDYVAFASKLAGTIDVYAPGQVIGVDKPVDQLALKRSGRNPLAPYKARAGSTPAGYRFVSSVPLAAWYQPNTNRGAADQDETLLYGFN